MYPQTATTLSTKLQGAVAYAQANNPEVRPSEVDHQMDQLANAVQGAEGLVRNMRDRLNPVLRSRLEHGQKETPPPPEEVLCIHGDAIRGFAKRVAACNRELDDMLSALAV